MDTLVISACTCRAVLVGADLSRSLVMWSNGDGVFLPLEWEKSCVVLGNVMMLSIFVVMSVV